MDFKAVRKETVFLNPQEDGAERRIPSEIRFDPLTGRTARICHFMPLQWEKPDLDALVSGTESWCPFCPDRVLKVTPCFPEELVPEGRMQKGDMVIFPNLSPYDCIAAIGTFGARHFVPMTGFTPDLMASVFGFALDFFRQVERSGHPESVYHVLNWNYMPVAGSSLIHPHAQLISTSNAPNLMRRELEASKHYRERRGSTFWEDLTAWEAKSGERYLGKIGRTHFMTTYAPIGVAGDVLAVVEDARCTLDLDPQDLHDLSSGIARAITVYDTMGIYSFNLAFFTGTPADDHFRFHLLFSPRTYFSPQLGTPDTNAMRNLFNETLCMAFPEEINERLKKGFEGKLP